MNCCDQSHSLTDYDINLDDLPEQFLCPDCIVQSEYEVIGWEYSDINWYRTKTFESSTLGKFPAYAIFDSVDNEMFIFPDETIITNDDEYDQYNTICCNYGLFDCSNFEVFDEFLKTLGSEAERLITGRSDIPFNEDMDIKLL